MSDAADRNLCEQSDSVNMRFAQLLAKLRAEQNISVRSLAHAMGMSDVELALLERGKIPFSMETLTTLAQHFRLDLPALFTLLPSATVDNDERPPPPDEALTLIRHFVGIRSSTRRRALIEHAKSLRQLDSESSG